MVCVIKTRPRKTIEDYMRLPEDVRAELIDGELLMSPGPKEPHQRAVLNLAVALRQFVRQRSLGQVYIAPFSVFLPSGDVVEPDIMFVSTPNLRIVKDWIHGAPDLLIEVLSPTGIERDRWIKRNLYERNGVREYWMVDTELQAVEVFTLAGEKYTPFGWFQENEILESPSLLGFSLPVHEIFTTL